MLLCKIQANSPLCLYICSPSLHCLFSLELDNEILNALVATPVDLTSVAACTKLSILIYINGRIRKQWNLPGLARKTVSVTFCIKMRPFKCSLGSPFRSGGGCCGLFTILFFCLLGFASLQHSSILSKRYMRYYVAHMSGLSRMHNISSMRSAPLQRRTGTPRIAEGEIRNQTITSRGESFVISPFMTVNCPCNSKAPKPSTSWRFQSST